MTTYHGDVIRMGKKQLTKKDKKNRALREYRSSDYSSDSCEACGWSVDVKDNKKFLDIHHIIPSSHGGSDNSHNLISLCPNCHRILHSFFYYGHKRMSNSCYPDTREKVIRFLQEFNAGPKEYVDRQETEFLQILIGNEL